MFKEKYTALNETIHPSKELIEQTKNRTVPKKKKRVVLIISTVSIILIMVYGNNLQVNNTNDPVLVEQNKDIYYKDLEFEKSDAVQLPQGQSMLDITSFHEKQIQDSDAVVKVTIEEVTVIGGNIQYLAKVDKVYYGQLEKGNEIVIEDNLFINFSCLSDSIKPYTKNNQFIVVLVYHDGYSSLYSFGNQIAITKNNEYIFAARKEGPADGWYSLITETSKQLKDQESFYYRNDDEIEKDIQALVDKYVK